MAVLTLELRNLIRTARDQRARFVVCAAPGCTCPFVPSKYRPDQRFCSTGCRNRTWQKEKR